jgi:hypothetical protein
MEHMGYRDLLPQIVSISTELIEAELSPQQRVSVLAIVGNYLNEWSEYHLNEFERVGEKQDKGAHEALNEIAQDFLSASRYATSNE